MPESGANYLRAAFLNVYNLSLLGGLATASALTHDGALGVIGLGMEALWLLLGPGLRPFQRVVDRQARADQEQAEDARMKAQMSELSERDWGRANALSLLRKEIARDMRHKASYQAILLQPELDKLQQLNSSFITLALACERAESYLSAADAKELRRQRDGQQHLSEQVKDPAAQQIALKNVDVLDRRLNTMEEIENFLARARGQMSLIENSIQLLRDQALTMASPDQLGEQLNDLLVGVDAIQTSAREHEAMLADIPEPIRPVTAPPTEDPLPTKGRIRS